MKNEVLKKNNLNEVNKLVLYGLQAVDENNVCDYDKKLYEAFKTLNSNIEKKITDRTLRGKVIADINSLVGNYEEVFFEMGLKIGLQFNHEEK